jgi:hypothetical protein
MFIDLLLESLDVLLQFCDRYFHAQGEASGRGSAFPGPRQRLSTDIPSRLASSCECRDPSAMLAKADSRAQK